jgi:ABC-type multidrug transport system ATPase subunit
VIVHTTNHQPPTTTTTTNNPRIVAHMRVCRCRVLQGVTGELRHGRMTAILGPSGSGKTTFLTTLAGKATYGKMIGQVYINGEIERISKYRDVLGFVPQEDVMLREMTVRYVC